MSRSKRPPEPKDDIPAWFMTYSDVITLLMTFFILLLTFATTEPERFEKSVSSMFSNGSATGTAGEKMKSIDHDSIAQRLRMPASRIAMRGSEMPPITRAPANETWGDGLRSLSEEEQKQNELTSHTFEVPLAVIFNSKQEMTDQGKQISSMLAKQLRDLPFRASLEFSSDDSVETVADMLEYLYHTEMTRPGQIGMSVSRDPRLKPDHVRIVVERFTPNSGQSAIPGGADG